jgi:DNA-binding response OmpR family regulator
MTAKRPTRILLVENDALIHELVRATFESDQYEVSVAADSTEVHDYVRNHIPDVVLLDVALSRRTEYLEICRELRANQLTTNVPVVMLTTLGQGTDIQAGYKAGVDDYMIKPFSPSTLTKRVTRLLRR